MYLERLEAALREVRTRIERACERSCRTEPGAVEIVGVTKGHSVDAILAARDAGLTTIGENRVREAVDKFERVGHQGLDWHMVGHLQRNKAKVALEVFSLIHSVDTVRLAREIGSEAIKRDRAMRVLVQIDASGEESKYGVPAEDAPGVVEEISEIDGIHVVGLMTMAPFTDDESLLRRVFKKMRELFERCGQDVEKFEQVYLSMGMTNDYELAVEEGSNMVRLGTVLFGERTQ